MFGIAYVVYQLKSTTICHLRFSSAVASAGKWRTFGFRTAAFGSPGRIQPTDGVGRRELEGMRFWGGRDRWLYGRKARTRWRGRESHRPRGTFIGDPRKRPSVADRGRRTRGATS